MLHCPLGLLEISQLRLAEKDRILTLQIYRLVAICVERRHQGTTSCGATVCQFLLIDFYLNVLEACFF